MPKKYSSAVPGVDADEIITTEGMSFELDDVEFTCHGELDAQDLVDLAPLMDAAEGNWFDARALAAVGHFYERVMGPQTYREFSRHRRARRTPPSVIAEIMMDLLRETTMRPPARPSPSPSGPSATGTSSAAAPPAGPERAVRSPAHGGASDPEGIIPPEMAGLGEVVLAAPAGQQQQPAEPAAGTHRVINLGRPGPPAMRPVTEAERAQMAAAR